MKCEGLTLRKDLLTFPILISDEIHHFLKETDYLVHTDQTTAGVAV